ncbi:hypothetical protein COU58_02375 [Candidatus Pacearchaeota archaeon CG10_big_fil_rev_8_21_14_0_10_32_42]|nr:MAG: hypothetical protein COU58_02375 [Candidatus Pacearchaeota archaeon CG10_big_fil_rev_8_21_14_0_10_32_42]
MIGKKGLSTVVTTLIIILLVLAAIGIIWGPIKSLLSGSTESLSQTKCLDIDLKATKVINTSASGDYNVTLKRIGGAADLQVGAKLIFYSDTGESDTLYFNNYLFTDTTQVRTETLASGFADANRIEVIPYLIDSESGEEMLCSTSTEFSFSL